jgi:radical SAM superfamily enzyme YgiQ (UPF0313 family)
MDQGYRPRSANSIISEIRHLMDHYAVKYIYFADELLMCSAERTISLCKSFMKAGLNFHWWCNGRLNYADPGVLNTMKAAGCVFINYGIESIDNEALLAMNKALTVDQIIRGVENTIKSGISPGLNIIFGNIGETLECLNKDVDFLLKYDDHSQLRTIRPVTPYPGSSLFDYAVKNGLLEGTKDFYENKHTNSDLLTVNFTKMTDGEYYDALFAANARLLENHICIAKKRNEETLVKLYKEHDAEFRGFRPV